ncbi:MAG: type II toxin-antitoxin system PemK/MazF family toxin [Stagnimonas sp.]|nr:type II toxin-antitoxin system PemK/MazF family toxin [Stagnimonas sp.]
MSVQPRDVVLLPFPFTDLSAAKLRPVLVLRGPDSRGDFLAAQITSQAGHALAVALAPADYALHPLPKTSYARPDKLFTLHTSQVVRRDSQLSEAAFQRVHRAVCAVTGC